MMKRIADLIPSAIDIRLSFRMLAKYPGLTIVGGFAFAFAIWMGAATFELMTSVINPRLPLPGGDRIVGIQLWNALRNQVESQVTFDLVRWRSGSRTIAEFGAFRNTSRNLITSGEIGVPMQVAEMTATGFSIAGVAPSLGRALVAADEQPGAPAVVVIGHEVWREEFGGDATVIGREVRLGRTPHIVVGVMPSEFAFPSTYSLWTALRLDEVSAVPRQGPSIRVFGRLAAGASMDAAQAELTTIGQRIASESPETHRDLRPQVMPYARSIMQITGDGAMLALAVGNLPLVLLVILICGNVGLLMFARAASRETELVIRTALGASRGRIVMQLFTEALVLGTVAAIVGLAAAGFGLRWVMGTVQAEMMNGAALPFWLDHRLSPATYLYTAALTLLGAVIAGVVPALKVTRGLGERLKQTSSGAGGLRFGGIWTVVIVAQVAVTVTFPAVSYVLRREGRMIATAKSGVADERFLSLTVDMDREPPPEAPGDTSRAAFLAHYDRTFNELRERLRSDKAVVGVTYAERLPRMYHPHRLVEMDSGGAAPLRPEWPAYRVSSAEVDPSYFKTFDAPILSGRDFHSGDLREDEHPIGVAGAAAGTVIVNESFVRLVLGGRNAIGRRLRYHSFEDRSPREVEEREDAPWYEIVGVVPDLGMAIGADVGQQEGGDPKVAGIYHAARPAQVEPALMGIKVHGDPQSFERRLRELAVATDPALKVYAIRPLARLNDDEVRIMQFWTRLTLGVSGVAILLSLAGIYAVMSFTLSRRTREIGIRVALGANRPRVLLAVFRKPLAQVSLGIVVGAALTAPLASAGDGFTFTTAKLVGLGSYILLMLAICLTACIVPARRAMRIEPSEALRAE
jgi:putative ABC transport system permease protein